MDRHTPALPASALRRGVDRIARLTLVTATVLGGAPLGGCGGDLAPARLAAPAGSLRIQQLRRDVHFDLGAQPPGGRFALEVAGRSYPLAAHTAATLARYRGAARGLRAGVTPSHYLTAASFSREAPQSYTVVRTEADGARTLVAAGIHMPGREALGAAPLLVGAEETAMYLVYSDPTLLALSPKGDPSVPLQVQAHIRSAPSFRKLVESIDYWGPRTSLEDQEEHLSGWSVTLVSRDSHGAPISYKVPGTGEQRLATHFATAGSPEWRAAGFQDLYDIVDGRRVRVLTPFEILAEVRKQARLAVRDDQALAGKMWTLQKDVTVRPLAAPRGGEGALTVTLDDTQWTGDRRIKVVKTEGRKITFQVANNAWRRQGVLVRFRDVDGRLIAKKDLEELPESEAFKWVNEDNPNLPYSTLLNIVDGRFTVLGVPLSAETVEEFAVELPEGASTMEVNIASAGLRGASPPAYVGQEPEPLMRVPGEVDTMLLDVALPILGLAAGAGSEHFTKDNPLVKELATIGVEVGVNLVMHAAATAGSGVSAFSRDYAYELLTEVITKSPSIGVALVEWAAQVGAEKALEAPLALIGAAIEAIEITGTLAGIAETVGTVALSAPITYNRVAASETLAIVVTPRREGDAPGYFSPYARRARAYVYYGHSTVPTQTAPQAIDPGAGSVTITLPEQPVGGEVRVKVALESGSGWVAGEGEAEVDNNPTHGNVTTVPVTVEQNPVPIDARTRYAHDRVLVLDGGKRAWRQTATPPQATAPQVCNPGDTSRPWLCGAASMTFNSAGILGYAWTGSGTGLRTCGGATNVVASLAQSINVNPAVGGPDQLLRRSPCASEAPVFLAFDPTGSPSRGRHVVVQQVKEPGAAAPVYGVFPVDIGAPGDLGVDAARSLGRFRSPHLDEITMNPASGMLLGLDRSEGVVEVLKLAPQPGPIAQAPASTVVGGQGKSIGRLDGARALAFLPAGAGFLVLEAGRVQAFTFDGASVDLFGGKAAFPLREEGGARATYTDMKIDPTESYVYVTSYVGDRPAPADYRLDIYRVADGGFVSRTEGVVGAKIALDRWRDLYTLNYANLAGATWPEPSVSEWVAPPVEATASR